MKTELVAILSVLEGSLYKEIKEFWDILKNQYDAQSVQIFEHPSITVQGGKIDPLKMDQLRENFILFSQKLKPYPVTTTKMGHIGTNSLYFNVEKDQELEAVNILTNSFLQIFCDELIDDYIPENWIPHIALAVNDLTELNFERFWNDYASINYKLSEQISNLYLVKFENDGNVTVLEKAKLQN